LPETWLNARTVGVKPVAVGFAITRIPLPCGKIASNRIGHMDTRSQKMATKKAAKKTTAKRSPKKAVKKTATKAAKKA